MKILHIIPAYLPAIRYGGPVQSVHSLNVALVRVGHDVTVFTTNIDGPGEVRVPLNEPVMMDGVRVFYFNGSFPRSWFYSVDLHYTLATRIREFDIVHITSVFLAQSTLGAYYAKKFNMPYIISPRGSLMKTPLSMSGFKKQLYISLIERRNLAGAAAIHFTVPAEEREYREAGLPLNKAIVVPNSIPAVPALRKEEADAFRAEYCIPADNKVVLFMGRVSPIKGLDTLIPAFASVVNNVSHGTLVVAGGDDRGYMAEVKKIVADRHIADKVVFTGMLHGEEKEAAYAASDVFVMPSVSESFGMSAVEAMHAGTTAILTEGVGIAEDAKREGAAVVVKKEEAALANAITTLLNNDGEREKLGRKGVEFVEQHYSEKSVAQTFTRAYEALVSDLKK